ncbi:MAG: DUF2225 domain-containing protein [Candidatus Riflebacteria bacterium]|nr:DUF2225 domain-containing protein [Candidatus Riflebacteria bacterium]
MALNEKLFFPKEIVCPVCTKPFTRYALRKTQFSLDKRDIDYRPTYLGDIKPRLFAISLCPHCFYAAEDKYFCPSMSDDERRRKDYFASHKSQWEAQNRVKAASSGQQIWKDQASEKLKTMAPEELAILRKISPLLQKAAADIIAKGKPANELQKEGDLDTAIRAWELSAICYKARRANHRILGYTYLNGAWTARDCAGMTTDEKKKEDYEAFEAAFLREAVSFLTITNKATSIEDQFMPDGTRITKENLPESRIFEIMYILAGANRLLGNIDESNKFLEQIIYGGGSAQGVMLWFVKQARDMRADASSSGAGESGPPPDDAPPEEEG